MKLDQITPRIPEHRASVLRYDVANYVPGTLTRLVGTCAAQRTRTCRRLLPLHALPAAHRLGLLGPGPH